MSQRNTPISEAARQDKQKKQKSTIAPTSQVLSDLKLIKMFRGFYFVEDEEELLLVQPSIMVDPQTLDVMSVANAGPSTDGGLSKSTLAVGELLYDGFNSTQLPATRIAGFQKTSAPNTQVVQTFDIRGINQVLSIVMSTSAGTATVKIEASGDGTTFITIDSIAAAGSTIKSYILAHNDLGGTTAVSPLSFRYVKITIGTAGVGNTTTTTVAFK